MVIQLLCVVAEGGGGFEPRLKTAGPSLEEQIDSPGRPSSPMITVGTSSSSLSPAAADNSTSSSHC